MDATFPAAIKLVLDSEGGFVDNPLDPGGATNMGITIGTLEKWRGHPVTKADVKALTKDEAAEIYRKRYWDAICGDDLPSGLDLATFDYGVNSGLNRAVGDLQRCLSVPSDGIVGPVTLKAASAADPAVIIAALCNRRMLYLKSLATFATFGKGWTARVERVRAAALKMAQGASPAAESPAPAPEPTKPAPARPAPPLWRAVLDFILAILASLKGMRK